MFIGLYIHEEGGKVGTLFVCLFVMIVGLSFLLFAFHGGSKIWLQLD
jgi:hypothetical protein